GAGVVVGFFQRHVDRQDGPHPQVALVQLGHELAARNGSTPTVAASSSPKMPSDTPRYFRHRLSCRRELAFGPATRKLSRDGCKFLKSSRHRTGASVKARIRAPSRAKA